MPDALDACRLVHSLEHLTIGGGFLEIRELMDFGKALAWFGRDIYRTQKVRVSLLHFGVWTSVSRRPYFDAELCPDVRLDACVRL